MGCRIPTLMLGEITPRGDVYSPPDPYRFERRKEYPINPDSRQDRRVGQSQDRRTNGLEEIVDVRFGGNDDGRCSFVH